MPIRSTYKICGSSIVSELPRFDRGFGAVAAVTVIAFGSMALAFVAYKAAADYSESIDKEEARMQSALNKKACEDSAVLMRSKDIFAKGAIYMPEFGCSASL